MNTELIVGCVLLVLIAFVGDLLRKVRRDLSNVITVTEFLFNRELEKDEVLRGQFNEINSKLS